VKRSLLIAIILFHCLGILRAQSAEMYERLSMPAVPRALSLYKGQLQLGAGLFHNSGNSYFDRYGGRLSFEEARRNYLANNLHFSLGYGILDFIEIHSSISLHHEIESYPTWVTWNGGPFGSVNSISQTKGLDNLFIGIRIRQPFFSSGPDFTLSAGLFIPVSLQNPGQPGHSITRSDPADPGGSYELNYLFHLRPGTNSTLYQLGARFKYSLQRIGIELQGSWRSPLHSESTRSWKHRLYGEEFIYRIDNYNRMPQDELGLSCSTVLQAFPWFACYAGYLYDRRFGGWTEESGSRVSLPTSTIGLASLGLEIQVTTNLRISQFLDIPLTGTEHYRDFRIRTTANYSLVPFQKLYY
jgi:hypothetical protein